MGVFQIWHIEFLDKKSKIYFEKLRLHQRILCSYSSYPKSNETTYHMGWQGYNFGSDFLNKHLKKINIKKFYSLDLSCRTNWYNELKNFRPWDKVKTTKTGRSK
ncbi:hypothetical protein LCGC14_2358610 [marine sediment metagenome]|uniref:Uncharacterized protein n=1 Tax=marine sediment metagenome TaxID=412755 RepID=A0A0F9C7D8_9ZZZZ